MAPASLVSMFVAPVAGRMSDRIGGKYILMAGLLLFAGGHGLDRADRPAQLGLVRLPAPQIVAGIGIGCTFAPMTTVALRNVNPMMAGAASGVFNTTRQVGTVDRHRGRSARCCRTGWSPAFTSQAQQLRPVACRRRRSEQARRPASRPQPRAASRSARVARTTGLGGEIFTTASCRDAADDAGADRLPAAGAACCLFIKRQPAEAAQRRGDRGRRADGDRRRLSRAAASQQPTGTSSPSPTAACQRGDQPAEASSSASQSASASSAPAADSNGNLSANAGLQVGEPDGVRIVVGEERLADQRRVASLDHVQHEDPLARRSRRRRPRTPCPASPTSTARAPSGTARRRWRRRRGRSRQRGPAAPRSSPAARCRAPRTCSTAPCRAAAASATSADQQAGSSLMRPDQRRLGADDRARRTGSG